MRAWLLSILCCCVACDDAGSDPAPADAGSPDATAGEDAAVDAALDSAVDAAVEPDGAVDMAVDAAPDAAPPPDMGCLVRPSPRGEAEWRVEGCDWRAAGEGVRVPRAMVVSADSLVRGARTPLHTEVQYAQLAALDVDWVWFLVTWDGIAPRLDTFNGAYLGRVCEQIGFADAAGLGVVLSMHQERWGVALGGHGAPVWATPPNLEPVPAGTIDDPALDMAWEGFWTEPGRSEALRTAWNRLLDTCEASTGVIGIQPLADPRGDPADVAAWTAQIRADAEARFGSLLLFVDGAHPAVDAPDVVWSPTIWGGRGPSMAAPDPGLAAAAARTRGIPLFVRGTPLDDAGFSAVEGVGAGWAGWHDGFGSDAMALRDEDGVIGPLGPVIRDRIWPVVLSGGVESFGTTDTGFVLRWRPDGRNAGLSVLRVGADAVEAELIGGGPDDFTAHDPITGELSVFVQADDAQVVELRIRR